MVTMTIDQIKSDAYDCGFEKLESIEMPVRYGNHHLAQRAWAELWQEGYNDRVCLDAEHEGEKASGMYDW